MLSVEQQLEFMTKCIALAKQAEQMGEVPVAALVIKDGKIIGSGINRRKLDSDPSAHAEIVALREAGKNLGVWNLSGCDLIVTLEPCAMCAGAIVNARIDAVYFGAFDTKYGYCGSLGNIATDTRLNHRSTVVGGIMADECLKLLQDFFKSRR